MLGRLNQFRGLRGYADGALGPLAPREATRRRRGVIRRLRPPGADGRPRRSSRPWLERPSSVALVSHPDRRRIPIFQISGEVAGRLIPTTHEALVQDSGCFT